MIEFKNISKKYAQKVAVSDVNLTFETGEFIVFIGTSGSGKTTCMRMINRMIEPTTGSILIDGKNIMEMDAVSLRRKIGYVIQQIGLMPHMTVYENIVLVPTLLHWDEERKKKIASRLIQRVNLSLEDLKKYPAELSGGQQQRIGVIRALAADQEIILMDEPFGALDPITRDTLQQLVKTLQQEMGKTIVFVSHDIDEALKLADKICIMDKGSVIQFDTPKNILQNPASEYVENLIGEDRLSEAKTSYDTVDTIMIKDPVRITTEKNAYEAITLMREKRVDSLFVTDTKGILQGAVSIFDIGRAGRKNLSVSDIMQDVFYIRDTTVIRDAVHSILDLEFKNLPVVDKDHRLIGLITRATIVDNLYRNLWGDDEKDITDTQQIVISTHTEGDK